MADKTMPPNDSMTPADPGMAAGDMAPPMDAPPADGGSVMVSMPKVAFDAMHSLVSELAKGLDALAQGVNQQAAASAAPEAQPMAGEAPASPSDEEFLKGMAEEGSIR